MASNQPFADGDLGRIQGLLFGDAMSKVEAQLEELRGNLADEVSRLEADLQAERDARAAAESTLREELTALSASLDAQAESLGDRKLDRDALASILDDAAGRLRGLVSSDGDAEADG